MKIAIVYSSLTNNTKLLAEALKNKYIDNVVFCGKVKEIKEIDADIYFLGSWTDKGDISNELIPFVESLNNKRVFLFGTCGFGGSEQYYLNLYNRFKNHLDQSNEVLGHFYCQGKMPLTIKERYISLIKQHPEDKNLLVSIDNFDKALSHPDQNDINDFLDVVDKVIKY
ncbi:MAG: flavodoxin family protein [Bacilli bacterium]|nr:flavodoxin family protein [Bacilli bacterium]